MSDIYLCGRVHKSRKHKLCTPNSRAKAIADAVYKIMLEELSDSARRRWCSRLNTELGGAIFDVESLAVPPVPVPRVWVPAKPKITLALLDEFVHASNTTMRELYQTCTVGSDSVISKLLTKHAVERLRDVKGTGWLEGCGELTASQLNDPMKLNHALSRVAFDLLVYVYARAMEFKRKDGADALLELHSSDQTLVGRAMRGCGVVFCEKGREIFTRALAFVTDSMLGEEKN